MWIWHIWQDDFEDPSLQRKLLTSTISRSLQAGSPHLWRPLTVSELFAALHPTTIHTANTAQHNTAQEGNTATLWNPTQHKTAQQGYTSIMKLNSKCTYHWVQHQVALHTPDINAFGPALTGTLLWFPLGLICRRGADILCKLPFCLATSGSRVEGASCRAITRELGYHTFGAGRPGPIGLGERIRSLGLRIPRPLDRIRRP